MGAWLPPALDDQHLAGGILWGAGDLVGLVFFLVLFAQWVAVLDAGGAREDRRLDLLESRDRGSSIAAVSDRDLERSNARRRLPGAGLQRRREHPPAGDPGAGPAPAPGPARGDVRRGRDRARGHPEHGRRWHRPGHPRRRGRAGGRAGHRQAAQGRDLPVPADPGADRPPAGRLAGDLVARGGRGLPPDRPDPARRRRRRAAALARPATGGRAASRPPPDRDHLARRPGRAGRRSGPDRRPGRLGDGRDPRRRRHPRRRSPASPWRCAPRARPSRRSPASPTRCSRAANPISVPGRLLDVVGTGGDRSMSVNISTMAAIVAAGAGATRGQARQPLGVVGVRLGRRPGGARHPPRPDAGRGSPRSPARPASPSASRPAFHPAMRHAAVPRRELGIGTTFNFLGPLTNPTRPAAQAIGCADPRMAPVMAGVFAGRGVDALGVPGRRRPRRAHHDHDVVGVDGPRRRGRDGRPSTRRRWASRRPPPRTCAAATPRTTPRWYAGCWTASPGRCATPCCSTPERRWPCTPPSQGTWPRGSPQASSAPAPRSTTARPPRCSSGGSLRRSS